MKRNRDGAFSYHVAANDSFADLTPDTCFVQDLVSNGNQLLVQHNSCLRSRVQFFHLINPPSNVLPFTFDAVTSGAGIAFLAGLLRGLGNLRSRDAGTVCTLFCTFT